VSGDDERDREARDRVFLATHRRWPSSEERAFIAEHGRWPDEQQADGPAPQAEAPAPTVTTTDR
jgi:hypothetical protein